MLTRPRPYADAAAGLSRLASPAHPNCAVRDCAAGYIRIVDLVSCLERGEQPSPGLASHMNKRMWSLYVRIHVRAIPGTAQWFLCVFAPETSVTDVKTKEVAGVAPPASVIGSYDELERPGVGPRYVDSLLHQRVVEWAVESQEIEAPRLPDGGLRLSASPEQLGVLRQTVSLVEYSLNRVNILMGDRTEQTIRHVEEQISVMPSLFTALSGSFKSWVAYPSTETAAPVRKCLDDMTGMLGMGTTPQYGSLYNVDVGGCVLSGYLPFIGSMRKLAEWTSRVRASVYRRLGSTNVKEARALMSELDGWASIVRDEVSRALWHTARSRKSPGLWR